VQDFCRSNQPLLQRCSALGSWTEQRLCSHFSQILSAYNFLFLDLKTLLYDIRSSQPYLSKSHNFGLPITQVDFAREQELVLSMDGRVLKLWNEHSGQPFTSLEPGTDLNSFARYQNSGLSFSFLYCTVGSIFTSPNPIGLIFFANDDPKVRQYFVPSLGPAPRWCSQLESITEELEAERSAGLEYFNDGKANR
jgi:hypothetical protein